MKFIVKTIITLFTLWVFLNVTALFANRDSSYRTYSNGVYKVFDISNIPFYSCTVGMSESGEIPVCGWNGEALNTY